MGTDALKDLREWQRRHASTQERSLRSAIKARARLEQLEVRRIDLVADFADAIEDLGSAGVSRDQAAALLGVTPSSLPPRSAARTKPDAQPTEPTGRAVHASSDS